MCVLIGPTLKVQEYNLNKVFIKQTALHGSLKLLHRAWGYTVRVLSSMKILEQDHCDNKKGDKKLLIRPLKDTSEM